MLAKIWNALGLMASECITALLLLLLESTVGQIWHLHFTWSCVLPITNLNYSLIKLGFVPESNIILLLHISVNELLNLKNSIMFNWLTMCLENITEIIEGSSVCWKTFSKLSIKEYFSCSCHTYVDFYTCIQKSWLNFTCLQYRYPQTQVACLRSKYMQRGCSSHG